MAIAADVESVLKQGLCEVAVGACLRGDAPGWV